MAGMAFYKTAMVACLIYDGGRFAGISPSPDSYTKKVSSGLVKNILGTMKENTHSSFVQEVFGHECGHQQAEKKYDH